MTGIFDCNFSESTITYIFENVQSKHIKCKRTYILKSYGKIDKKYIYIVIFCIVSRCGNFLFRSIKQNRGYYMRTCFLPLLYGSCFFYLRNVQSTTQCLKQNKLQSSITKNEYVVIYCCYSLLKLFITKNVQSIIWFNNTLSRYMLY